MGSELKGTGTVLLAGSEDVVGWQRAVRYEVGLWATGIGSGILGWTGAVRLCGVLFLGATTGDCDADVLVRMLFVDSRVTDLAGVGGADIRVVLRWWCWVMK